MQVSSLLNTGTYSEAVADIKEWQRTMKRRAKNTKANKSHPNRIALRYETKARIKGLGYKLTRDQAVHLITQACHYCGGFTRNGINGIDRVDNEPAYITGKVVSCCKTCNFGKGDMTSAQFEAHLDRLVAFRQQNKL